MMKMNTCNLGYRIDVQSFKFLFSANASNIVLQTRFDDEC